MAGLGHGPVGPKEDEDPAIAARNARNGLMLFAIYFTVYAAFVALNAFWPEVMATKVAGVNLAVVYGFGLIAAALVLALVYTWLCRAGRHSPHPLPSREKAVGRQAEASQQVAAQPPGEGGSPGRDATDQDGGRP